MRVGDEGVEMIGVTEYGEGYKVKLVKTFGLYEIGAMGRNQQLQGHGRLAVRAQNEGGHNSTEVDLLELISWVKKNRPDLLK